MIRVASRDFVLPAARPVPARRETVRRRFVKPAPAGVTLEQAFNALVRFDLGKKDPGQRAERRKRSASTVEVRSRHIPGAVHVPAAANVMGDRRGRRVPWPGPQPGAWP